MGNSFVFLHFWMGPFWWLKATKLSKMIFLDQQYLSIIKCDFYKTFRESSCGDGEQLCFSSIICMGRRPQCFFKWSFLRSTISQHNQVWSLPNFQGIFLWWWWTTLLFFIFVWAFLVAQGHKSFVILTHNFHSQGAWRAPNRSLKATGPLQELEGVLIGGRTF